MVWYAVICQNLVLIVEGGGNSKYTLCVDRGKGKMGRKESNNESFKWLSPLLQARSFKL